MAQDKPFHEMYTILNRDYCNYNPYLIIAAGISSLSFVRASMRQFVMWMQQGRICILGKIEFSIDNENADKNAQVKLYFMPELKVILSLWKK